MQRDWGISWIGNGRIAAGVGAPDTFVASPPGNADGNWHHVAFTRDRSSGRLALYVDGAPCGQAEGNKERLDAPQKLMLGAMLRGDHFFHGRIDDLRCYDRALSGDEVLSLWLDLRGGIAAPAILLAQPAATGGGSAVFSEFAALQPPELHTVRVLCAQEAGAVAPASFVRIRGNVHQRGVAVVPAVPAVLAGGAPTLVPPADGRSTGRRSALADWITATANPLSWRVLANRLWQWHFGRGLARTPNDFGRLGEPPTHPQLLDWLASEVLARGGSLKAMHRLLVTSQAYRMASAPDAQQAAIDPRNDHCWRFDRRRLFAEEVRDSILAASGALNLELGGPPVFPPLPRAVLATASRPDEAWGESTPAQAARRSVYVHLKRSLLEPLLAVFDLADTDTSCPVRFATVQPTQALQLLNGAFAQQQAAAFAARLSQQAPDLRARLQLGYRLVAGREPSEGAVQRLLRLHADLQRDHGRSDSEALQRCCLLLLNGNEFLFVD